jgi:apolipoprotein N-acyltransferase
MCSCYTDIKQVFGGVLSVKTLSAYAYRNKAKQNKRLKTLRVSALLFIWLSIMGFTLLQGSIAMSESREPSTVVISEGDTLWKLAKNHAPRGVDTRRYLDEIYQENKLNNAVVYPGQIIVLP